VTREADKTAYMYAAGCHTPSQKRKCSQTNCSKRDSCVSHDDNPKLTAKFGAPLRLEKFKKKRNKKRSGKNRTF